MADATHVDMAAANGRSDGPTIDVTFLVAAYNVAPFVTEAVQSALMQTGVRVEVIVVDDASTDPTPEIVGRMAESDARIVLIRSAQRSGPGAARNRALAVARGQWVAMLDGDDFVAPERTRTLLDCAAALGADLVGDNFERVTEDGQPTGRTMFSGGKTPFVLQVDAPAFLRGNLMLSGGGRSLGAVKILARTDFLRAHGIGHPEDVPVGEDFHFILDALFRGARFVVSSTTGYKYRMRRGSQSWRLSDAHIDALLRAHAATLAAAERSGDEQLREAANAYGAAMARSGKFVRVVTDLKARRVRAALGAALVHPGVWPLLTKFGFEAAKSRIARKLLPHRTA